MARAITGAALARSLAASTASRALAHNLSALTRTLLRSPHGTGWRTSEGFRPGKVKRRNVQASISCWTLSGDGEHAD